MIMPGSWLTSLHDDDIRHEEPANFHRASEALFSWLAIFFYFSGGFISYLFGDYENIDMWRSDYMMNDRDNDNFNYYIAVSARGQYKWILSWLANQAGKMGPSCPQCRRGVSKAVKDSQNEEDKRRSWVYCAKTQLAFHPVPQRIRKLFKQFHSKSYNDLVTSLFLQPSSIVY